MKQNEKEQPFDRALFASKFIALLDTVSNATEVMKAVYLYEVAKDKTTYFREVTTVFFKEKGLDFKDEAHFVDFLTTVKKDLLDKI